MILNKVTGRQGGIRAGRHGNEIFSSGKELRRSSTNEK